MLFIMMMWMVMLTQSVVKRTFLAGCLLHLAHLDGLGVQDDEGAGEGHVGQGSEDEVGQVGPHPTLDHGLATGRDQVGLHTGAGELAARGQGQAGEGGGQETTGVGQGLQVQADSPAVGPGHGDVEAGEGHHLGHLVLTTVRRGVSFEEGADGLIVTLTAGDRTVGQAEILLSFRDFLQVTILLSLATFRPAQLQSGASG